MSYANGRFPLAADSHIMELPNFLSANADPDLRDRSYVAERVAMGDRLIRGPKEAQALGAFDSRDRRRALDLLGFQRVFGAVAS